ncbi:MAG TPA: hypothetical protein PKN56_05365 [Leptospiraceae bacterium]|nr:hypothetical protein [Leptospiraceae bacterium]
MKSSLINSTLLRLSVLLLISLSNCAVMEVYDNIYPDHIKSPFNPSDLEKVSMPSQDTVKFYWKSFLFRKSRCFKLTDQESIDEVNAHSVTECGKNENTEVQMKQDSQFPLYWLPILNADGDILDLKNTDNYSYYYYTEAVKMLKNMKLKTAMYNQKENAVILSGTDGKCQILQRYEYGWKIAGYSVKELFMQTPEECRKWISSKNESLPVLKNKGNTVLLEFKDRSREAYTAPEGNGRQIKYLRIHSLDNDPNYLYAVLYPPALLFDLVTFPFQFVYLYMLAAGQPPR